MPHPDFEACLNAALPGRLLHSIGGLLSWDQETHMSKGAIEAGLQYLEKEVAAKRIIMSGFSLGGGMMSEAILQHEFEEPNISYMMVSDRTFNTLSDRASVLIT